MNSIKEFLTDLTWDDLRQWAGTKILNRGKRYKKNVYDLARTEDGGMIAWVSGTEDYATYVDRDEDGELDWFCSCPFDWGPCKHAVALILTGLDHVETGKKIPLADKDGDLYLAILDDSDEDDEDFWDEDDLDEEKTEPETTQKTGKGDKNTDLIRILKEMNKKELLGVLLDLAARHPEVKRRILENDQLQRGDTTKLAKALRKEIIEVTGEDAWYNPWKNEGNRPDYSHIHEQLAALLKEGHADTVVELGRELWKRGNEQVEQSHDEGDTAWEIGKCMVTVFQAVTASALSCPEQLLWMIDIILEDEFSICDSCERFIRNKVYKKEDWFNVSRNLQERLKTMPKPKGDNFSLRYQRERVMNWLIDALKRSDQDEEVLRLLEKEAHATQCYERIADIYFQIGDHEKAREWCITGFQETVKDAPGIASGLQKRLRKFAEREENMDLAAAYRAQDFFDQPGILHYIELKTTTDKIDCWPTVRALVINFLKNGQRPDLSTMKGKKQAWPLPSPEVAEKPDNRIRRKYPDLDTLIDIAIYEKRNDDVVQLYQAEQKTCQWGIGKGEEVAKAVVNTHPDLSLAIWRKIAEEQIGRVKPSAYEEAAIYLRKMHKVYKKEKRLQEWQDLISAIRTEHKAKRRLQEVLDSLENRRIID